MTISYIRSHNGVPTIYLDDRRVSAPVTAYAGPRYTDSFRQAGIDLYTFYVPGTWWVGPGQYDFAPIDLYLQNYIDKVSGGYFMPRIDLSGQGFPWWGKLHPGEMNILRSIRSGEICDQLVPNPRALPYLGHDVNLDGLNLHSFHSKIWREEAGNAVAALISHCEAAAYADKIWAWHLCDGLFCEWFHWNEYSFEGMADYSEAAQSGFRSWLKRNYKNDSQRLSKAWGRLINFDEVVIPMPSERMQITHDEFYDPVQDRASIDYAQCFNEATADSIIAVCKAAKQALAQSKLVCVFYGYQFSNMPRPQLNGHYALQRLLDSEYVDMLASPHSYSYRGEGGYHSPQCVADSVRRAGKIHFDEIDCKTVWTPSSVSWKKHISQPQTVAGTIEMLKKDSAYQMASGTAQWWMDLTDQGWFDAPEAAEAIHKLKTVEEQLQKTERGPFGEVALVVSQRSMFFQAPREGLHNATLKMFRNWHLSRMGAPFEQLLLEDLGREDIPSYKLYIMANLFHVSKDQRALIDRVVKRNNAVVLWVYAPGYLDDDSASLENMRALTGIQFGIADIRAELNVSLTSFNHAITQGLPGGMEYGSGVKREQYLVPPKIQYLPDTQVGPAFYAEDDQAHVLGISQSTQKPGLVVKEFEGWRSIYSAAPLLSWELMRNIAHYAGVHIYSEQGDMLWANQVFLGLYSQSSGIHQLRFPRPVELEDAYTGKILGKSITSLDIEMECLETGLFFMR
jgi:hypothetical protein